MKFPTVLDMPDLDEIELRFQKAQAWTRDRLSRPESFEAAIASGAPISFNMLSLPGWLEIARLANVPHIPAREVHSFPLGEFISGIDGDADLMDAHETSILSALEDGEMLRMEQVAPAEIKANLSGGKPMGNGTFHSDYFGRNILNLAEDRFYSTLRDSGEDQVRAYARPIISARMKKGVFREQEGKWPEEFRVFIKNGEITGISNYYPQIDMKPKSSTPRMQRALDMAQSMLDFMAAHQITPDNAKYRTGADGVSCTLDFLVTDKNEVLLLEGGPEGLVAAHPCCFLSPGHGLKETEEGEVLTGAVFTKDDDPISLDRLRKTASKDRTFHVSIDYTEGDAESYRGVVAKSKNLTVRFSGKGPAEDWADFMTWAQEKEILALNTSSVGHFCWDVPGWRFIEDEMGREVLVPEDRPEWDDHSPDMI